MVRTEERVEIYLEVGKKKTFAGAVAWPGWNRPGRDEPSALQSLLEYGPRYARVLRAAGLEFQAPEEVTAFQVIERLEGTATTDFGAPDRPPAADSLPVTGRDLQQFQALFQASWQALDAAVERAAGKELRKGPRGGGRELEGILEHVLGADLAYLRRIGWPLKVDESVGLDERLRQARGAILAALSAGARGELPEQGPRGGALWPLRYYVRRTAWHLLDHLWEIEDRVV